jgi:glucokinase
MVDLKVRKEGLKSVILAIDVGGTKTLVSTFSYDGDLEEERRFETPKEYPAFIEELGKTIRELKAKKFNRAAIAMPGSIDRKKGIAKAFGNLPWTNVPIKADLAALLKDTPVLVENDAKLAGLYEAQLLPDYRKVLYVTVSTGIGGGLIVNRKIDKVTHDAEYGHMLLEHDGKLQRWEEFASGKAIYGKYGKRAADITDQGDWYQIARNIAIGLIDVIAATTPDIVVLGGGVGSHFEKFSEKLLSELKLYEDALVPVPPVIAAKHAEQAVIYGCYTLARQSL